MRYIVLITSADGTKSAVGIFNTGFTADEWIEKAAEPNRNRDGINSQNGFEVEVIGIESKKLR